MSSQTKKKMVPKNICRFFRLSDRFRSFAAAKVAPTSGKSAWTQTGSTGRIPEEIPLLLSKRTYTKKGPKKKRKKEYGLWLDSHLSCFWAKTLACQPGGVFCC